MSETTCCLLQGLCRTQTPILSTLPCSSMALLFVPSVVSCAECRWISHQRVEDDETSLTRTISPCRAGRGHLGDPQAMAHGLQNVRHGAESCTTSHESTVLAFVFVVRTQKVREAATDLIQMQGPPLATAPDRVRIDQEHRMFHWVHLLMQPGQQGSVSAPASSSGSSISAKLSKRAHPPEPALRTESALKQKLTSWHLQQVRRLKGGERPVGSRI